MRSSKGIKVMFNSFIKTLPALANVGGLLMLILFIYSTMGVSLFSEVKLNGHLNAHLNFQNLGNAFITLLRVCTGENWHYVLHAISRKSSLNFECSSSPTYDDYIKSSYGTSKFETVGCGSSATATAFLMSYSFIVSMIFLNLFIAVILQGFDDQNAESNKPFDDTLME